MTDETTVQQGTPADLAVKFLALAEGCRKASDAARVRGDAVAAQHWAGFALRWEKLARTAAEYGLQQLEQQESGDGS